MTDPAPASTGPAATERHGFTLTWRFPVPRDRVFRAWTDPAHLDWFFNDEQPRPAEPTEVDLRVGGAWRQTMVIDAETRYVTGGVYREIVPDERLVFVFGAVGGWPELAGPAIDDAPVTTLTFVDAEVDGAPGTLLTLDLDFPVHLDEHVARELLGAMRPGWQQTVARLRAEIGGAGVEGAAIGGAGGGGVAESD
ncbi:SRPBCC family protein [Schumannella soli]|uniref:SRPBCC domain-containing protein n=1 Tax=Schumannella soli TaxID=2590779 RepID=A0A506XX19_9MICO|nr:SRPBCC domain-containing protein [Schumannella soli]TPW74173.1 SRPBCC domain-containing protein [Schumannella soli]